MVTVRFSKALATAMRETTKMIRYALCLGLLIGSTAALAHVQPDTDRVHIDQVVYFGEDARMALAEPAQPLILQKCAVEDCSDTPQN